MSVAAESVVYDLSRETIDWMAEDPRREDVADEVWAFALATYVDGQAITPRGFDVTETLTVICHECGRELVAEPEGSTLCRECFFTPYWFDHPEPLYRRLIRFLCGDEL